MITLMGDLMREESCKNHSNLEHLAQGGVCGGDFQYLRQNRKILLAVARLIRFCATSSVPEEMLIERINSLIKPEPGKINLQLCLLLLEKNGWDIYHEEKLPLKIQALKVCPYFEVEIVAAHGTFKAGTDFCDVHLTKGLNKKEEKITITADITLLSLILKTPGKYF